MSKSRKIRRLKRKLKRNLDIIGFGAFLLVGGLFFLGKFTGGKNTNAARGVASVPAQAGQKALSRTEQAQLNTKVRGFLTEVKKALKEDAPGISAFVLFMRQVAPDAVEKDEKLNQLCKTQDACPLPLRDVYEIGLARLDDANLPTAKEALQASMMKSSIHKVAKQMILAKHLIGTKMHKAKKVSKMKDKDNVEISPSAQYVLVTAKQLQMLKVPEQEYLQVMYKALANSNDLVAKKLILKGLHKGYPKFKGQIEQAAGKLGVKAFAKR